MALVKGPRTHAIVGKVWTDDKQLDCANAKKRRGSMKQSQGRRESTAAKAVWAGIDLAER